MTLSRIPKYFNEVWRELTKVTWPTRKDVVNHTVIVLLSSAIAILVVAAIDKGLSSLISYIISQK